MLSGAEEGAQGAPFESYKLAAVRLAEAVRLASRGNDSENDLVLELSGAVNRFLRESGTGAPDWRDAAKLRKFLADDIPQWTPSEGAENTRAFLAALREKCSTEIGAMTGLLLALF